MMAKTMRKLLLPILLAILLPPLATLTLGAILAIGETDTSYGSDPQAMTALAMGREDTQRRLGTTIAFRAGLIRLAAPDEVELLRATVPDLYRRETIWFPVYDELDFCANSRSTIAILATESYLRPAFLRRTEQIAAEITQALTGGWPDWSYGPAQIRPSTVARIADLTDARLRQLGATAVLDRQGEALVLELQEPCPSAALIDLSLSLAAEAGDGPKEHALRHLGGLPVPTLPGVIEYTDMVAMVESILSVADENAVRLSDAQFPAEEEAPLTFDRFPDDVVWPATGWTEPQPRLCLTDTNGSYAYDRSFAPWPEGAEPSPLTAAILVPAYAPEMLWQDGGTISWNEASDFLHGLAAAAAAAGLPVEALAVAPPDTYPLTQKLIREAGCSAIILQAAP
jgi:hypothetical protein